MMRNENKTRAMFALAVVAGLMSVGVQAFGGQISSFENDVNPAHQPPGTGEPTAYTWGDSFDANQLNRAYSLIGVTDGDRSMAVTKPAGGFSWGIQYLFNDYTNQPGFRELVGTGTADVDGNITLTDPSWAKILIDMTTLPNAQIDYSVGFSAVNYGGTGGFFIDSYNTGSGAKNYQFTSGPASQTEPRTQTYTWDLGGQFTANGAPLWTGITNYLIYHLNVNSGNLAVDSTQFWDNFRVVNENILNRPTYNKITTADWTNAANWNNGVPNGVGAPAIFYGLGAGLGSIAANATVNVNSGVTVGSIIFDSQITSFNNNGASGGVTSRDQLPQIVNYNISGTGNLTFDVASGNSELYVIAGAHNINVPVQVNDNLDIDTSGGFGPDANSGLPGGGRFSEVAQTSVSFNGTMTIASGATVKTRGAGQTSFTAINGSGAGLIFNGRNTLNGNVTVSTFTVNSNASVGMSANGGRLINTNTLAIGSITIDAATAVGQLDLNDNDMLLRSGTYGQVAGLIAMGRNGGAWTGRGLTSSAAAAATPSNKSLGAVTGAQYLSTGQTAFDGVTVNPSDILVKFTYYGDTDLNGVVNFDDYSRTDNGFNSGGNEWFEGDFDYNNTVNFDDYSLIDLAFNSQSGTLIRAMNYLEGEDRSMRGMDDPALQKVVDHFAQFGQGYANSFLNAVPEPSSALAFGAIAGLAIVRRRRRGA